MKLLMTRQGDKLAPVDVAGAEALSKVPLGKTVSVEVKQSRNAAMHRLYWVLLNTVHENADRSVFPTVDNLHDAIKLACGVREQFVTLDGEVVHKPGSIAWHKMDQSKFSAFYDRVCDLICEKVLPGMTPGALKAQVEDMVGVRRAA